MTKNISCRLIQPEDYAAMSQIIIHFLYDESAVRDKTRDSSDLRKLFENEKFLAYFVLEESDSETGAKKIIGGAGIQHCQYPTTEIHPRTSELCRFYIDPTYRGNGVGKFFLSCLIDFAKKLKYERLLLETIPGKMDRAISMYRSAGFFETENRPAHCWDKTGEKKHLFMEVGLVRGRL
jgi:GNAT superfamily N-acetyltransferase